MTYADILLEEDYVTAERNGIPRKTVYHRVQAGHWPKQRAITEPVKQKAKNGTGWRSYKDTALVCESVFYERIREGMTPDQAAHTPPKAYQDRKRPAYTGVFTPEVLATAAANGIKESTAKARVYVYKWTVQDAITIPTGSKRPNRKKQKPKGD